MKNIFNISILLTIFILCYSCEEEPLPEAGSIADATPPSAGFTYEVDPADYLKINFINSSISSTDFSWDFGNGASSVEKNPSVTYAEVGTYTVTLISSDKLNKSSSITQDITIEEPVVAFTPEVLEGGFEDNSLPDGSGDGRDSWRNEIGGVIQITSSPVHDGEQAAKLPSAGDRTGLQMVTVLPNTEYNLSFYYTMKADPGTLTVAILSSEVTDAADVAGVTIASLELSDNSDPNTYVKEVLTFNSGDNSEVGIYFNNIGSECRLDNFEFE